MFKVCLIFALIALGCALPVPAPVEEVFQELPCLNRVAGQRLPHPKNPHQFLRCVTADTVWIETCPDNLFYNPHSEICDWDTVDKSTTTTLAPEVVRTRPVLVKFRPLSQVAHARMETTVIDDENALALASTPRPDSVLTTSATTVTTTPVVEVVTTTTPRVEFVAPVEQQVVVVSTTTPRVEFVVPAETTTPRVEFVMPTESVVSTTPVLDVVVVSTTTPVVIQQQVAQVVPVVQQQVVPAVLEQSASVVIATTPAIPVIEQTTTLPIIEMSTPAF